MELNLREIKFLVVGAGFYGAVVAEHIARDLGQKVVVIDKRDHTGGNCHSQIDPTTGIEYHTYGTHIFHTRNQAVWNYIARFTQLNAYRHQVLATYKNRVYQMPINLETINTFYGTNLKPFEVRGFLEKEIGSERFDAPANLEERAISLVGRPLYEAFLKGYTEKQWGCDATAIPASVIARLPFRTNYDENYFFDAWQGIPVDGYAAVFDNMLDHPNIEVVLGVDFMDLKTQVSPDCLVVYTGTIDRFFHYKHGRLDCRTLRFETEVVDVPDYQGTSVMNYTEREVPFTRIHEPRHLHPERESHPEKSFIVREYSETSRGDSPYYPIPSAENDRRLALYTKEREAFPNVLFGGRLGDFKYYDMDVTIDRAMDAYAKTIKPAALALLRESGRSKPRASRSRRRQEG
ncbi:MAG: UDP-galactopyranose mutase [Myxococcota bacterium]